MSKSTRIVATAIPHSTLSAEGLLQVSVSLSPQLFARGSRVQLGRDYYEVYNWPLYRRFFEQAVHFRLYAFDDKWILQAATQVLAKHKPLPLPTASETALALWQHMLPANTPVSHWEKSDLPYKLAQALTVDALKERMRQALEDTIQRYFAEAPADADGAELAQFEAQVSQLADLPVASLLAHPFLTSAEQGRPFKSLYQTLNELKDEYKKELDNLLLRLELTEVAERNINETTEFHKRFSAYGQHPELLRRTGWLWDYVIDPAENEKAFGILKGWMDDKHRVFIAVDRRPFDLSNPDLRQPDPNTDRASVFSTFGGLDYSGSAHKDKQIIELVEADPAPPVAGQPRPDHAAWLAFLNELDVSFPLTALKLQAPHQSPPGFQVLPFSWQVRSWQAPNAQKASVETAGLFEQFQEYVQVTNKHFEVRSRLVDRAQLFRRIETLVLTQREQIKIGADTGAQLAELLDTQAALSTLPRATDQPPAEFASQPSGYVANGITLYITNTRDILTEVLKNKPSTQQATVQGAAPAGTAPSGLATNENIADLLKDSALIYQHNVQNGYRVDVAAVSPGQKPPLYVGSLCSKQETYSLPGGQPEAILASDTVEGWVSEPAQLGQDGHLFVDEELFHWNDWNLITPFGPDESLVEEDRDHLRIATKATPCSLVPLRFRWKYSFALRPVDICGTSARPVRARIKENEWRADDFRAFLMGAPVAGIQDIFTPPIEHQRVDGVHQPQLFLSASNPRTWDRHPVPEGRQTAPPHEHLPTLVVRSLFDGSGLVPERAPNGTPVDDVRLLAPPRISLGLLLQHEVLDEQLRLADPASRRVLMQELVRWDAVKPPQEDIRRVRDDEALDYLADPLADGFVLKLNNQPYNIPLRYSPLSPNPRFHWRYKYYHRLRLRATAPPFPQQAASVIFEYDAGQSQPTETLLKLRAGFRQEISLSCLLPATFGGVPAKSLFLPAVTTAYDSPLSVPPNWDSLVVPTPHQSPVTLIHAVEKPCLLHTTYGQRLASSCPTTTQGATDRLFDWGELQPGSNTFALEVPGCSLLVRDRAPQATTLDFAVTFAQFPVLTTETYRLHAFTVGLVCDRRTELGYRVEVGWQLIQSGLAPERSGSGPTDAAREQDVRFTSLRQTFADTRYYRVGHEIEAISKFSDYFKDRQPETTPVVSLPAKDVRLTLDPNGVGGYTMASAAALNQALADLPLPQSLPCPPDSIWPDYALVHKGQRYDDKALAQRFFEKTDGNPCQPELLAVPSTSRPQPPTIRQTTPLLDWQVLGKATSDEGCRVERQCRAFRLYFEGDWYSSGWGEQVAILFRLQGNENLGTDWEGELFSSSNTLRFSKPDANNYQELSISSLSSQLGSDPTSTARRVPNPIDDTFFRNQDNSRKTSQQVRAADLEWDNPTYASPGPEIPPDLLLNYVLYPVKYASARQLNAEAGYTKAEAPDYYHQEGLFYVDVYLNPAHLQNEYFPFLRFAVARYQPTSIQPVTSPPLEPKAARPAQPYLSQRYCFSKVVLTDFCQPLPHRSLTLHQQTTGALTIGWPASNQLKQYQDRKPARHFSKLVCFAEPDTASAVSLPSAYGYVTAIAEPEQDEPTGLHAAYPLPLAGATLTLPPGFLPPGKQVLVVSEYEYHENDELPAEVSLDDNPRLDPHYRLVFSFTHRLTS